MVIAASRFLRGSSVCFIGIGYPSTAAMLALRTHAPELYLVYESGTLGPRPRYVPLSVADDKLPRRRRQSSACPRSSIIGFSLGDLISVS